MTCSDKADNPRHPAPSLPGYARLPINHCNLPAAILGGLSYQQHPLALTLDGVLPLHRPLFERLAQLPGHGQRAQYFIDYMVVQFRLHQLQEAGLGEGERRGKANYLRLLRGWLFNTEGREAAVLKGWVESRFGLLPRYHRGPLLDYGGDNYQAYLAARAQGLYGTNALEAQLDLLYGYCQYELGLRHPPTRRLRLYRGVNRIDDFDILQQLDHNHCIVLLNNLNSFSSSRERADEFGDQVLEAEVPWQKVLYYSGLFPHLHGGEEEYVVIGGVYRVALHTL